MRVYELRDPLDLLDASKTKRTKHGIESFITFNVFLSALLTIGTRNVERSSNTVHDNTVENLDAKSTIRHINMCCPLIPVPMILETPSRTSKSWAVPCYGQSPYMYAEPRSTSHPRSNKLTPGPIGARPGDGPTALPWRLPGCDGTAHTSTWACILRALLRTQDAHNLVVFRINRRACAFEIRGSASGALSPFGTPSPFALSRQELEKKS